MTTIDKAGIKWLDSSTFTDVLTPSKNPHIDAVRRKKEKTMPRTLAIGAHDSFFGLLLPSLFARWRQPLIESCCHFSCAISAAHPVAEFQSNYRYLAPHSSLSCNTYLGGGESQQQLWTELAQPWRKTLSERDWGAPTQVNCTVHSFFYSAGMSSMQYGPNPVANETSLVTQCWTGAFRPQKRFMWQNFGRRNLVPRQQSWLSTVLQKKVFPIFDCPTIWVVPVKKATWGRLFNLPPSLLFHQKASWNFGHPPPSSLQGVKK